MDPLSVSASIIAILGLADKIIFVCRKYVSSVKDAPDDLRVLLIHLGNLRSVIENLDFLHEHGKNVSGSPIVQGLFAAHGPIEGCRKALADLEDLLPTHATTKRGPKRKAVEISLAQLAWPFKEGKVRKLVDQIEKHKSTISLTLTAGIALVAKFSKTPTR